MPHEELKRLQQMLSRFIFDLVVIKSQGSPDNRYSAVVALLVLEWVDSWNM